MHIVTKLFGHPHFDVIVSFDFGYVALSNRDLAYINACKADGLTELDAIKDLGATVFDDYEMAVEFTDEGR